MDNFVARTELSTISSEPERFAIPLHILQGTYDARMSTSDDGSFPKAAFDWLVPSHPGEILAVGAGGPVVRRLLVRNIQLWTVDEDASALARRRAQAPGLRAVAAAAHALPFATCTFATVVVSTTMRHLAPGLALAEFARVLAPGGHLAVHQTARDDSVPWVRRLATILRAVDPTAMSTAADDADGLPGDSRHFPRVEKRQFRMWVPMRKEEMLAQVSKIDAVAALDQGASAALLSDVAQVYDTSARVPEPLLLPYTVTCWRAEVRHVASNVRPRIDDGLRITW